MTSRHPVLSVDTLKLGSVSASSASSQPSLFFCHLLLPVNVFGDRRGGVTGAACPEAAGKSSSSSLSSSASQSGSSWQADNPRDKHGIHMNAWYTDVFVLTITQKKDQMHKLRKKQTKMNHYAQIWHPQNTCKFDRALTTNAVIRTSVTAPAGLHFCSPLVFHVVVVFDHRANLNMWHFWKLRQFLWQKFPRAIQEIFPSIPCFFASNAHPGAFLGHSDLHLENATHFFNFRDDWPQTLVLVVAHDPRDIRIHVLFVLPPFLCQIQWSGPAHDEASSVVTPPSLCLFRRYPRIRRPIRSKTTRTAKTRCPRPTVDDCNQHPNPGHATGSRTRNRRTTTTTWRNEHWILCWRLFSTIISGHYNSEMLRVHGMC